MKDSRDNGNGRKGGAKQARRALRGCFLMTAVSLVGCGASVTGPGERPEPRNDPAATPLRIRLMVEQLDYSLCQIEMKAMAKGGAVGSFAEWGELKASSYDGNTGEFIAVSRPQPLYPDVFKSREIASGETQWGQLDLERFRRDEGVQVMVQLELSYRVIGDGADGQDQAFVATHTHSCR